MLIKVSELSGAALDWAVAKCEEKSDDTSYQGGNLWYGRETSGFVVYRPSINWAQGGPIVEREGITLRCGLEGWDAELPEFGVIMCGVTALEAAMRCYVASKLGDEVEVPNELV